MCFSAGVCTIARIRAASEQKAAEVHAMAVEVGRHICAKACRLWPLSARCPVGQFNTYVSFMYLLCLGHNLKSVQHAV